MNEGLVDASRRSGSAMKQTMIPPDIVKVTAMGRMEEDVLYDGRMKYQLGWKVFSRLFASVVRLTNPVHLLTQVWPFITQFHLYSRCFEEIGHSPKPMMLNFRNMDS